METAHQLSSIVYRHSLARNRRTGVVAANRILRVTVALALCASMAGVAIADTVNATKDCSLGPPCTVSGNPTPGHPVGFFRLTTGTFNWEVTFQATPGNFWVSDTGPNMATTKLNTSVGQLAGTATLPLGDHYISINTALNLAGSYSVYGPGVHGDPHITTGNGINYDFQSAGEFVLLKHLDNYEIQTRMTPVATTGPLPANPHTGLSTCVSINTAAAVRAGKQRVTYEPELSGESNPSGMQLRIDGTLVTGAVNGKTLSDGTRLWRDRQTGELRIEHRDYTGVRITPHWWASQRLWYLDYDLTPPPDTLGVAGDIPSGDWLPKLSDGSSMGAQPTSLPDRYKALYVKFADDWRVTDASTLFDYAPGTSTKTYTLRSWPSDGDKCELQFTVPVQGVSREVAERACEAVQSARLKGFCVFDVMATGNLGFGKGYAAGQGPRKPKGKGSQSK